MRSKIDKFKKKYYLTSQLAELFRLNAKTVNRLIESGEIKAYKIGRERRVYEDDLLKYLESCIVRPVGGKKKDE